MPATSKKQQTAMRIAKAVKAGKAKAKPGSASDKIAKSMTKEQIGHFTGPVKKESIQRSVAIITGFLKG